MIETTLTFYNDRINPPHHPYQSSKYDVIDVVQLSTGITRALLVEYILMARAAHVVCTDDSSWLGLA